MYFLYTDYTFIYLKLDISSSYPTNESVLNISKETTRRELCSIENKEWSDVKYQTLNLSGGYTNAVEFATELLDLPKLSTLLNEFKKHNANY